MKKNKLPKWNLDEIYVGHNDPKIDKDLKKLSKLSNQFIDKWKGKIKNLSGKEISNCLKEYEKINEIMGLLSTHSSLSFASNMEDVEVSRYNAKISDNLSLLFSKLIFLSLEISSVNNKIFKAWENDKVSKRWIPLIKNLRKRKKYQLSPLVEEILVEKSPTGRSSWVRLFDETSAALRFPYGKQTLTEAEILNKLSDSNPESRKIAGKSLSKILKDNSRLFGMILNVISRDKYVEDSKRGFGSILESRNLDNDIENKVVDSLVSTVSKKMPDLTHKYYKWKAKVFKKKKLDWWDRNAPLNHSENTLIKWDDAKDIVLEAFNDFNPKISKIAKQFFDNNWIDAEPRKGKASGAFAHPSVPSHHPYILMNYQGKVRDVMTLAHELGHGVHQVLASKNGYLLADTPLTLAETASVFGEMLVFQKLLSKADSKQEKNSMIAEKVEDMLNTVVRQIAFHNFETSFHNKRKSNELTPDEISEIWMETQSQALGDAINLDDSYKPLWSYIPHFVHTPFYVYAYAFGDCLVNSLWQVRLSGQSSFTESYINLLKSGGKKHHREALAPFGLDASDPEFWNIGLNTISSLIDELEAA